MSVGNRYYCFYCKISNFHLYARSILVPSLFIFFVRWIIFKSYAFRGQRPRFDRPTDKFRHVAPGRRGCTKITSIQYSTIRSQQPGQKILNLLGQYPIEKSNLKKKPRYSWRRFYFEYRKRFSTGYIYWHAVGQQQCGFRTARTDGTTENPDFPECQVRIPKIVNPCKWAGLG